MPKSMSRIESLKFGFSLPWQAAKLIARNPVLIAWSLAPTLITLGLYAVVMVKFQGAFQSLALEFLSNRNIHLEGYALSALTFSIRVLFFVVAGLGFSWGATLIACPFNDFLAHRTESLANPPLARVPKATLREGTRLLIIDFAKSLAATLFSLLCLILWWVPGLNLLVFGLTFLLVCFQFISYPQTRRGEGLLRGIYFLFKYFYACLGFGAIQTLLFALPLPFLFLPLAVVGGTLLYARAQAPMRLR